ncbi:ATP synthase subunit I [Rhabdobacter roseus]|uniref:F1F0 ATPase subunit 2 n=1 Tax=Rhabdobacter roseus TaxID=1655419 RepID=A0A840TUR9_9BACT|nr:ATP synthase subunit I [Rhabdobacter roseus]MBB5285013.1 F1F0 ATPase subunit 2 [Rhabdobacter roseus]
MSNLFDYLISLAGGLVLGGLYFGGLWLTVKKALTARYPALWLLPSYVLRIGMALAGFYWLSAGAWPRLLVCVAGFLLVRVVSIRWVQANPAAPNRKEATHET